MAPAFTVLQADLSDRIGQCLDPARAAAGGDLVQPTTAGLLVWRRATRTPAFTDGYRTWALGPSGLQSRLNSTRFPWEPGATAEAVLGASYSTNKPTLAVTNTTIGNAAGPLVFSLSGSGFRPNETVTIQGSYSPLQAGPPPHACRTFPLGPITVQADAAGRFTASLTTANPHTGVNFVIRAVGAASGPANLALSAVTPNC